MLSVDAFTFGFFYPNASKLIIFLTIMVMLLTFIHFRRKARQLPSLLTQICLFFQVVDFRFRNGNAPKRLNNSNTEACQRYFDKYNTDKRFRKMYNRLFRGPGENFVDKILLYMSATSFWRLLLIYFLSLSFLSGILFSLIYHLTELTRITTWLNTDSFIRKSITFTFNGDTPLDQLWLFPFLHWFILSIFSSIILSLLTKKMIERKPAIIFPKQIYFNPNVGSFEIWCWNRDIAFLCNFKLRVELEMRFTNREARDAFAKGAEYSLCSFWFKLQPSIQTLEGMMGFLISSRLAQYDEIPEHQRDEYNWSTPDAASPEVRVGSRRLLTNVNRKQECFLGPGVQYESPSGPQPLFDQEQTDGDDTMNTYRAIRVFISAQNSLTGQENIHIAKYAISSSENNDDSSVTFPNCGSKDAPRRIVCGVSRDLPGVKGVFYPNNWYDRNLLNMQIIDEIDSPDYMARVEEDKKRTNRRFIVERCGPQCPYYSPNCPLSPKFQNKTNNLE